MIRDLVTIFKRERVSVRFDKAEIYTGYALQLTVDRKWVEEVEDAEEDGNIQEAPPNASAQNVVHGFHIAEEFPVYRQNVQNVDQIWPHQDNTIRKQHFHRTWTNNKKMNTR